jgi:cytochrome P450
MTAVKASTSVSPRPPVADGLPLIGSLLPMLGDPADFMTAQYLKHGPVFRVKVLNRSFTVFAGPEAVEYMANEDETLTGEPVWKPFVTQLGGSNNITAMDGPDHARMRKVMRRGFSRTAALDTIAVTVEATRRVLRRHAPGALIPVAEFTTDLIAEVIGSITLGRAPGDYLPDFLIVWRNYLWAYPIGTKPKSALETPEYKRALARVVEMGESIIAAYERGELQPGESQFADDLITASKEQPDLVSRGDLMLGMIAPYVAGLDTVASIVLYMWYEIVRAPALRERLLTEIAGLFANGVPTPEQMRHVPILHATAMETMRYYNVAVMLPRVARREFEFAGRRIEAGEQLQMAIGVVHRLEKFYPNPDVFDIDRFLEPRNEHKQRNAFAPYGAGSHTCLGAGMAEVIMALMIATLIHEADYALEPANYRAKRFVSSTLTPAPDFRLRLLRWRGEA